MRKRNSKTFFLHSFKPSLPYVLSIPFFKESDSRDCLKGNVIRKWQHHIKEKKVLLVLSFPESDSVILNVKIGLVVVTPLADADLGGSRWAYWGQIRTSAVGPIPLVFLQVK